MSNWIELRHLRRQIIQLEGERKRLDQKLRVMRGGDAPLERMARKELGLVKPGEIEYRFPPPKEKRP